MKVLHVISDRNIGGAGILLLNLLRHFDRSRIESLVALPRGSALCERLAAIDVPYRELANDCDRVSLASVREIGRIINREEIELVHTNAALSARLAGRQRGVRVVHTRHCCFPPSGIWHFRAVRFMSGIWNRALSDRVIATAEAAVENLRQLGIPDSRITVIINGSEPVRPLMPDEIADFRRQWDIGEKDFCVGICARLVACKGHTTFLEAARLAVDRMPERRFRFLIAGDGEERRALERLTEELGLSSDVRFLGFLEDTAPFYRSLRVNVNCSCGTETSCLAISEGMSAGVPAIASDYGGNPAMIGHDGAGLLFPVGDSLALSEALCRIAHDERLERWMSRAARERYENLFTPARMTEQLTAVYESLF